MVLLVEFQRHGWAKNKYVTYVIFEVNRDSFTSDHSKWSEKQVIRERFWVFGERTSVMKFLKINYFRNLFYQITVGAIFKLGKTNVQKKRSGNFTPFVFHIIRRKKLETRKKLTPVHYIVNALKSVLILLSDRIENWSLIFYHVITCFRIRCQINMFSSRMNVMFNGKGDMNYIDIRVRLSVLRFDTNHIQRP